MAMADISTTERIDRHTKSPSELDGAIGRKIKARRLELEMTQQDLATACGVTFQQVQKYEKGTNRIAAGRLETTSADKLMLPMTLMAGIGLLAGALLITAAAKSVQEPLDSVRAGLDREVFSACLTLGLSALLG